MPIKEFIAITIAVMTSVFVAQPVRFLQALQEIKIRILRDVGRTNHWGNRSIFRRDSTKIRNRSSSSQKSKY